MKLPTKLKSLACCLRCAAYYPSSPPAPHDVAGDGSEKKKTQAAAAAAERRKLGGWKCMPYIIGNETFERVATMGLTANLTVYLVTQMHLPQVSAVNAANIFSGTTNFAPLLGAFVSDAYLGRYRTLAYASIATFLGMIMLTLTAVVPALRPPDCPAALAGHQCAGPSRAQFGVLALSFALLAAGSAGVRPCSLPFGVDQFDPAGAEGGDSGRRGLNSFFNWYYCTSTAGVVVALTAVVYIQDSVSWAIGFGVPTGLMLVSIAFFFLGSRLYVLVPPSGSVFTGIAQVLVAAYRKRRLRLPDADDATEMERMLFNGGDANRWSTRITKLPLTLQFRCLNKAAIKDDGERVKEDGTAADPWRLCAVQRVEEVKCLLRIIPIWASGIVCFVALGQQWTFAVLQSLRMDRHLGRRFQIPPGSLASISLASIAAFIPVYDRLLVPVARRFTGIDTGITLLQRQGIGMAISVASMVVAAAVEVRRRESAVAHGGSSPMSAMWLSPQLVLMGVAEAFNAVGQVEFYNRQFPEQLQTLAGSLFFCSLAGASYMSSALVAVVRRRTGWLADDINAGRLENFYYLIAALGVLNLAYFLVVSHFYRYKGATGAVPTDEKKQPVAAVGRRDVDLEVELIGA